MSNQENASARKQPDALRRRLVKGGLAAPVVLATLASKPVLAVSWNCTISGQLSGNTSSHGEACTSVGSSANTIAGNYPYNAVCGTESSITMMGTLFPNLKNNNYFYIKGALFNSNLNPTKACGGNSFLFSGDGSKPNGYSIAAINQILHLTESNPSTQSTYARKALILLLNAKAIHDTSLYPLTQSQAERMYVAAATGGGFTDTNPTVNWSNSQVLSFIDLIYH